MQDKAAKHARAWSQFIAAHAAYTWSASTIIIFEYHDHDDNNDHDYQC